MVASPALLALESWAEGLIIELQQHPVILLGVADYVLPLILLGSLVVRIQICQAKQY